MKRYVGFVTNKESLDGLDLPPAWNEIISKRLEEYGAVIYEAKQISKVIPPAETAPFRLHVIGVDREFAVGIGKRLRSFLTSKDRSAYVLVTGDLESYGSREEFLEHYFKCQEQGIPM